MNKLTRRDILQSSGALLVISAAPIAGWAATSDMNASILKLFGERPVTPGRVSLKIPPISENGYSVSLGVNVDSPMSETDYVKRIAIFSERNPIPLIAIFHLSSASGLAQVSSRIRLSGTQNVHAIAEMNDGSLWSGSAKTLVTVAACVVL